MLLEFGLLVHLLSLLALATGSFGGIVVDRMFWTYWKTRPAQAAAAGYLNKYLGIMAQVGSTLMLLSGIFLLWVTNWTFLLQFWIIAKLSLFVLLFLNGYFVANPASLRLTRLIPQWLEVNVLSANPVAILVTADGGSSHTSVGDNATAAHKDALAAEFMKIRQRMVFFHVTETLMFILVVILAVFKFS